MSSSVHEVVFDRVNVFSNRFQYPQKNELKNILLKKIQIQDEYASFAPRRMNKQEQEKYVALLEKERQKCCEITAREFGSQFFPIEKDFFELSPSILLVVNRANILNRDEIFGVRTVQVLHEIRNEIIGREETEGNAHSCCAVFSKIKSLFTHKK